MTEAGNYQSPYWALIYDQMMARDLEGWRQRSFEFYGDNLAGTTGPVLECACGTGIVLLRLLDQGINLYGFDSSPAMLSRLIEKRPSAEGRVSCQRLESFRFPLGFDAVLIPTNSFSMLTTREAQVTALKVIAEHLNEGGRLMMDLRLASTEEIDASATGIAGRWHEWIHPHNGDVIYQRIVGLAHDYQNHCYRDQCEIEYREDRVVFPMIARWTYRNEFESLLAEAGFRAWHDESTDWGSYWIIER